MKKCPFCAEEIQDAAIVCRFCGRDLEHPTETVRQGATHASRPKPTPKKDETAEKSKKGLGLGCLTFLLGAWFVTSVATTYPKAILVTLACAALSVGAGYLGFSGKMSQTYGTILALAGILVTLLAGGQLLKHREEAAQQAAVEEQKRLDEEKKQQHLEELQANKGANFEEGKSLLASGDIEEAMKRFRLVQEVDPRYAGLDAEMGKAQEALAQKREEQLLADLKGTQQSDAQKRRDIYRELSQLRPDNKKYASSYEQYQSRTAQADKKAAEERAKAAAKASAKLQLLSWSWSTSHGYATVEGQVKNISGQPMKNVEAVASFFTSGGEFITSDDAIIDYNPILPGQTSPFKVMSRANPAMNKARIDFKVLFGQSIPWYKE